MRARVSIRVNVRSGSGAVTRPERPDRAQRSRWMRRYGLRAARRIADKAGRLLLASISDPSGAGWTGSRAVARLVPTHALQNADPRSPDRLGSRRRRGSCGRARVGRAVLPSAIVPGAVNRTSLDLSATYDVRVKLSYGAGRISATSTMVVTNVSGGPIDRLELNTIAARLGRLRITSLTVDGAPSGRRSRTRRLRAARRHPPRRRDGDGPDRLLGNARRTTGGSDWLFTRANGVIELYRWLPWISAARPFNRPNHGDPFVTRGRARRVRVTITTDRAMRLAHERASGSPRAG